MTVNRRIQVESELFNLIWVKTFEASSIFGVQRRKLYGVCNNVGVLVGKGFLQDLPRTAHGQRFCRHGFCAAAKIAPPGNRHRIKIRQVCHHSHRPNPPQKLSRKPERFFKTDCLGRHQLQQDGSQARGGDGGDWGGMSEVLRQTFWEYDGFWGENILRKWKNNVHYAENK